MDESDKKELIEEFKKGDGPKRLDLWDYALAQQVLWENIIADLQRIAHEQGVHTGIILGGEVPQGGGGGIGVVGVFDKEPYGAAKVLPEGRRHQPA